MAHNTEDKVIWWCSRASNPMTGRLTVWWGVRFSHPLAIFHTHFATTNNQIYPSSRTLFHKTSNETWQDDERTKEHKYHNKIS